MEHREIYLAGGCFWGIEHLMQQLPGVVEAQSGYANGSGAAEANYRAVCGGDTGFREAVRVVYDPARVSLEALLLAYFYVVDVTVDGRQGPDVGSQYQSGIYYEDAADAAVVERIAAIERAAAADFCVEIGPLRNFYPAEEYHQDYLQKNPFGYCHIPREEMRLLAALRIDPGDYVKPAAEVVREKLGRGEHNEKQPPIGDCFFRLRTQQKPPEWVAFVLVAETGLEPATSGL